MSFRVEQGETRDVWSVSAGRTETAAAAPPDDLAAVILELLLRSRGAEEKCARVDVERANDLLERARREMQRAMDRADEADRLGNFWGDVSNALGSDVAGVAGVVAAVALAIATGGAGTAAVIAVVAACLTAGAKVGQELGLDPRATAVMGAVGGALGLFAGNAAGAGNAWTTVAQVSSAVQGGASGAGGGASIVEGQYRGQAVDQRAQAAVAENRQNDAWLRFDLAIAALEQANRDVAHAREGVSNIERTQSDGAAAIVARIGAA